MPENKCYFCTDLNEWIEIDKENGQQAIYTVNLVRQIKGTIVGQSHHLKYCPECGKKIDFDELYKDKVV